MCVLIVEDCIRDQKLVVEAARRAGFRSIEVVESLRAAQSYLSDALRGDRRIPDAMILDLCLGMDSGYELLRSRYFSAALSAIRVIVWTEVDDHNRKFCEAFKADAFVGKWSGAAGLRVAFSDLCLPRALAVEVPARVALVH